MGRRNHGPPRPTRRRTCRAWRAGSPCGGDQLLLRRLAAALASRGRAGRHMTSSVEVVIVNWNTGECLRACLASLAAGRRDMLRRLTVVDNGSADHSAAELDTAALPLRVLRNRDNVGFAAGCNQGAAGATATYILFLNPDTRVFADALDRMVRFMDSPAATEIGICGAQIVDEEGRPGISCARFPTLRILFGKMTRLDRLLPWVFPGHHLSPAETDESRVVDQVIGAAFL